MKHHTLAITLSLCGVIYASNTLAEFLVKPNDACYIKSLKISAKEYKELKDSIRPSRYQEIWNPGPYISQKDYDFIKSNGIDKLEARDDNEDWPRDFLQTYMEIQPRHLSIDIKKPSTGKIGEPTVYDASASTVPSGNREFYWEAVTGGLTFDSTNSPTVTVTARNASNSGLNAYTRLKLTDATCKISQTIQFNVNYTE